MAFESQKKQLISTVISTFNKFVDVTERIDERSMKDVVQKVYETLSKYEKSDLAVRRLLNIGKRQTLEDAVAQLIIN